MESVNDTLFKQNVNSITLDINTLVLFNKKNPEINYKEKLLKLEKYIIKPLIVEDVNKLYEKLISILMNEFDIGEDYDLFTGEIKKYCLMCIDNKDFNIEKSKWSEILKYWFADDIMSALIKKGKKVDMKLFLDYESSHIPPFRLYNDIITIDNIPDVIDSKVCQYIKNNLTLNYIQNDKLRGLFFTGPVIKYEFDDNDIPFVTDNSKLKVVIKILLNCKLLVLISDYLKEKPIFDLNDVNGLDFLNTTNADEDINRLIYNLQKEEFIRLLKEELNIRVDINTREYIRLIKTIEANTGKKDIAFNIDVNSYEKKLKKVIDDEKSIL